MKSPSGLFIDMVAKLFLESNIFNVREGDSLIINVKDGSRITDEVFRLDNTRQGRFFYYLRWDERENSTSVDHKRRCAHRRTEYGV